LRQCGAVDRGIVRVHGLCSVLPDCYYSAQVSGVWHAPSREAVEMSSTAATSPRGTGRGQRVTIADIAERAGVTSAAVSLAVNGRPGVSDATRARVMDIARELHWEPSHAAR